MVSFSVASMAMVIAVALFPWPCWGAHEANDSSANRELGGCNATHQECRWILWCCSICKICCHCELMEDMGQLAGKSLRELNNKICVNIATKMALNKGLGCLDGITMSFCIIVDQFDQLPEIGSGHLCVAIMSGNKKWLNFDCCCDHCMSSDTQFEILLVH